MHGIRLKAVAIGSIVGITIDWIIGIAMMIGFAPVATLELRLFRTEAERAPTRWGYLQNLYDSLRFLGTQQNVHPDRVSVTDFSFGGILVLLLLMARLKPIVGQRNTIQRSPTALFNQRRHQ